MVTAETLQDGPPCSCFRWRLSGCQTVVSSGRSRRRTCWTMVCHTTLSFGQDGWDVGADRCTEEVLDDHVVVERYH